MKNKNYLAKKIRNSIANVHYYLESVNSQIIMIYDYDGTSYILKQINGTSDYEIEFTKLTQRGAVFSFIVNNISFPILEDKIFQIIKSDSIYFIPIDGLNGLSKGKTSQCDFVFFNDKNFCFVEMKLNATSLNPQTIQDNRDKAVNQLKNTINFFDTTLTNNYCGLNLDAFIATPDTYPSEDTAFQSIKVKFLEETRIKLFESRVKKY